MTMTELRKLPDDTLLEISLRKGRKDNYTPDAKKAMQVRRERSKHWDGVSNRTSFRKTLSDYTGNDGSFVKKFK